MKDKNTESIKINNTLYKLGIVLILLALLFYILIKINRVNLVNIVIPCLINKVTGYYCPGCGSTRALQSLINGKILQSLRYHPVVFYGIVLFLWYMFTNTIQKISKGRFMIGMNYKDTYIWIGFGIMIINFLFKNISILLTGMPRV